MWIDHGGWQLLMQSSRDLMKNLNVWEYFWKWRIDHWPDSHVWLKNKNILKFGVKDIPKLTE